MSQKWYLDNHIPRLLFDYLDIPSHNKNTPTSTPSLTTLHNNHLSILTILQHTTQTFPTYKKIHQNHQIPQPTSKIISSLSYNHTISPSHYSDSIFYLIQKNLFCNNLSLNHKYFNLNSTITKPTYFLISRIEKERLDMSLSFY